MRLKGKTAIITGAGTGIGRASAIMFAKEGALVVAAGRTEANLHETVEIITKNGGTACAFCADVKEEKEVKAMVDFAHHTYGTIDILFNNAGVGYSSPYVMDSVVNTPSSDWDEVLAINLKSVFLCCKYTIPYMKEKGKGVILNCSSINGVIGCGADAYSASKGGINALTRAMAVEHAPYNIRVNVVSPGATDTPMIQSAYKQDGFYDYWSKAAPLKRMAIPEDVAYAAVFLVSDESAFITGQNLMIDGGLSIS